MQTCEADGPAWSQGFTVHSATGLQHFASRLAEELVPGDLLILTGGLGAGKTTFTRGLGEGLGVRAGIISPTFVLVRIHPSLANGPALVHADAYRLGSAAEIDDLDLESTMDSAVTVVEWGAGRVEHLAASWLEITLGRPTGAGASRRGAAVGRAGTAVAGAAVAPGPDAQEADDDEPRQVLVAGFGPRWANTPPAALLLV